MTINWEVSKGDAEIIRLIAKRAAVEGLVKNSFDPRIALEMDLTAIHANGCALDLDKLLSFDRSNFVHDITGIMRHVDRDTAQLSDFFVPRCACS